MDFILFGSKPTLNPQIWLLNLRVAASFYSFAYKTNGFLYFFYTFWENLKNPYLSKILKFLPKYKKTAFAYKAYDFLYFFYILFILYLYFLKNCHGFVTDWAFCTNCPASPPASQASHLLTDHLSQLGRLSLWSNNIIYKIMLFDWNGQNIKNIIYKIRFFGFGWSKNQEYHIQNKVFLIGIDKISRISYTK